MSIAVSFVFGWFFLLCLLFSIQDFEGTVGSEYGQPVLQIFVDCFGKGGAIVAMTVIMVCVWHCGLFSLTSNSRMMFAFSRDRALPGFFDYVDPTFKSPIRTIGLAAFLAFVLALPSLGSSVAFFAATSIAFVSPGIISMRDSNTSRTIGLYVSYTIPIAVGIIFPQHFHKGPFNLGKMSKPIGTVACLWVCHSSLKSKMFPNFECRSVL